MKNFHFVYLFLFVTIFLAACSSAPETIELEVTRIVEQEIEVTRIVEVEVTRIVTPTALPGGVYGSPQCDEYIDMVDDLFERWTDVFDVASSTARVNLSDRVVEMQEIRREMATIEAPDCATQIKVQSRLVQMMEDGIKIFTQFMAQNDTSFETAIYLVSLDLALDALQALRNGESQTPQRIHYLAFGETGFSAKYIDETGEFQTASEGDRFGYDDHPVVFTTLMPQSGLASINLYNATYGDRNMTCVILVNGEESVVVTGIKQVVCELE